MKTTITFFIFFLLVAVVLSTCRENEVKPTDFLSIQTTDSPAAVGSSEPNLSVGDDGRVYLSWIEPADESRHTLRFAIRKKSGWSQPRTIAVGANWFVNWADFPSLVAFADSSLAAHWLVKSGEGAYAYNVNIACSSDGGKNWSKAMVPHRDGTETEHGFVSMLPWMSDQLFVVWLDGRNFSQTGDGPDGSPSNEMTLRFIRMDKNGQLFNEQILDTRVCDCCPTAAVRTPNGAIVVYRDRSANEIRDISIVRFHNGAWSKPRTLYSDGWKINGCPVNGPAIAAEGADVAVAWFTMANDTPRVKVIFSNNEGSDFGQPIIVDDGEPLGRVDVVLLSDGAALVSWMEATDNGAEIRVRRILPDNVREPSITVSKSGKERASGFPRMVRSGDEIVFAWTQAGSPATVRTAVAKLNGK
ncbi:MAG: hypothetical protein ACE5HX_04880 [bacterium]